MARISNENGITDRTSSDHWGDWLAQKGSTAGSSIQGVCRKFRKRDGGCLDFVAGRFSCCHSALFGFKVLRKVRGAGVAPPYSTCSPGAGAAYTISIPAVAPTLSLLFGRDRAGEAAVAT